MPAVTIIGTRGYPSYYGGFETAVRKLAPHLVDAGWDVTVYGRRGSTREYGEVHDVRVQSCVTRGVETKNLSTLSYGLTSTLNAARRKPDVALVMNVANGYFLPALAARGIPSLMNVDGIEWERAKWSPAARKVFHTGARLSARWATNLVFDARAIEDYWRNHFNASGKFIPYGGDSPPALEVPDGLRHRGYVLVVARFVPENSLPEFFAAVPAIAAEFPVVIVGSSGYGGELDGIARGLASQYESVRWLGHVSDDNLLLALWQHAGVYFHGHSVGGTNPALVQAMASGAPIVARDTIYNHEVLGPSGSFVAADGRAIASTILKLMNDSNALEAACQANRRRANEHYDWTDVCGEYESALRALISA